jgi:uncharacterized protein YegL
MSEFNTQSLPKVTIIKGDNDYSLLSINTYDINNESIEINLILLIDISGSMSGIRLDLVLHAIKVIINASGKNVKISIYTFDSTVKKITDFESMTPENKTKYLQLIGNIRTMGSTNLKDAINIVLDYCEKSLLSDNTRILIFTDGEPDDRNIQNYDSIMNHYFNDNRLKNCVVDLFGFGNNLNQDIMTQIYQKGKGVFGFISDQNMLGTIFNYYIANIFTTIYKNIIISYTIQGKDYESKYIECGDIQIGQERNFLIPLNERTSIDFIKVTYFDLKSQSNKEIIIENPVINLDLSNKIIYHKLRYSLIEIIKSKNIYDLNNLYNEYSGLHDNMVPDIYSGYIKSTLDDMKHPSDNKGQIEKAFISYNSWGKFYLMSFIQSLVDEITINFKDASIQHYSGTKAKIFVEEFNTLFTNIQFVSNTRFEISNCTNRDAPCFHGSSLIKLVDGIIIPLEKLVVGDKYINKDDKISIVEYIIKTEYHNDINLLQYDLLIGTGNHPIFLNNKWIYLKDAPNVRNYYGQCDYIYSISSYTIDDYGNKCRIDNFILNNIPCSTFGHGYLDSDDKNCSILCSTFWGIKILNILSNMNLPDSVLTLKDGNHTFLKDPVNNWTYDLKFLNKK